jgi:transcriptional regulator with GAF, ATPase, and Fis domain
VNADSGGKHDGFQSKSKTGNHPTLSYSGSAIRLVESPEFPGALRRLKECVKNLRMDKSGREWPDFYSSDHEL